MNPSFCDCTSHADADIPASDCSVPPSSAADVVVVVVVNGDPSIVNPREIGRPSVGTKQVSRSPIARQQATRNDVENCKRDAVVGGVLVGGEDSDLLGHVICVLTCPASPASPPRPLPRGPFPCPSVAILIGSHLWSSCPYMCSYLLPRTLGLHPSICSCMMVTQSCPI